MADEVDRASEESEVVDAAAIDLIRKRAVIAPGYSGECTMCGEDMPRLINGVCCRCRDKYKLG